MDSGVGIFQCDSNMSVAVVLIVISCLCHQLPEAFAQKSITLPKGLKLCKSGDNECLKDAISSALQLLRHGIPSLGIQALDPVHLDTLPLDIDLGSLGFKARVDNVDAYGIDVFQVKTAKGEFGAETYRLELSGFTPLINIVSDYVSEGRILSFPFKGQGKGNMTFTGVDSTMIFKGKIVKKKDGNDYVRIDACEVHHTLQNAHVYFSNLFGANKAVGDGLNDVLNENWRLLEVELRPSAQRLMGRIFKELAFRFYDKIPYRMLHKQD